MGRVSRKVLVLILALTLVWTVSGSASALEGWKLETPKLDIPSNWGPTEVIEPAETETYVVVELEEITVTTDKDTGAHGPEAEMIVQTVVTTVGADGRTRQQEVTWPFQKWVEVNDGDTVRIHAPIFSLPKDEMGEALLVSIVAADDDSYGDTFNNLTAFVNKISNEISQAVGMIAAALTGNPETAEPAEEITELVISAGTTAVEHFQQDELIGHHENVLLEWENWGAASGTITGHAKDRSGRNNAVFRYRVREVTVPTAEVEDVTVSIDRAIIHNAADENFSDDLWDNKRGELFTFLRVANGFAGRQYSGGDARQSDTINLYNGMPLHIFEKFTVEAKPWVYLEAAVWDEDSSPETADLVGIYSDTLYYDELADINNAPEYPGYRLYSKEVSATGRATLEYTVKFPGAIMPRYDDFVSGGIKLQVKTSDDWVGWGDSGTKNDIDLKFTDANGTNVLSWPLSKLGGDFEDNDRSDFDPLNWSGGLRWSDLRNNKVRFYKHLGTSDDAWKVKWVKIYHRNTGHEMLNQTLNEVLEGNSRYTSKMSLDLPDFPRASVAAPSNLSAKRVTRSGKQYIDLTWRDNASNESRYRLRWVSGDKSDLRGPRSKSIWLPANTTSYSLPVMIVYGGGWPDYSFEVTAVRSDGWEYGESKSVSVTLEGMQSVFDLSNPPTIKPPAGYLDDLFEVIPLNPSGDAGGDTGVQDVLRWEGEVQATGSTQGITLTWTAQEPPEDATVQGYYIFRSTSPDTATFSDRINDFPVTETQYTDTLVSEGTTYYYVLRPVYHDGSVGPVSPEVSAEIASIPRTVIVLTIGSSEAEVNGQSQELLLPAYIENGTTMVPLRFVSESMGATVDFWAANQSIDISLYGREVRLWIGSQHAQVDGEITTISVPPTLRNNVTFVPIRFVSEGLGARVGWNGQLQEVTITYPAD